jgi:hypothetical protein
MKMKITITLDTEILTTAHPEKMLNNALLDSLGREGLGQAGVGSLILLANIMPLAEFKAFAERAHWAFKNHIPSSQFRKMD